MVSLSRIVVDSPTTHPKVSRQCSRFGSLTPDSPLTRVDPSDVREGFLWGTRVGVWGRHGERLSRLIPFDCSIGVPKTKTCRKPPVDTHPRPIPRFDFYLVRPVEESLPTEGE